MKEVAILVNILVLGLTVWSLTLEVEKSSVAWSSYLSLVSSDVVDLSITSVYFGS